MVTRFFSAPGSTGPRVFTHARNQSVVRPSLNALTDRALALAGAGFHFTFESFLDEGYVVILRLEEDPQAQSQVSGFAMGGHLNYANFNLAGQCTERVGPRKPEQLYLAPGEQKCSSDVRTCTIFLTAFIKELDTERKVCLWPRRKVTFPSDVRFTLKHLEQVGMLDKCMMRRMQQAKMKKEQQQQEQASAGRFALRFGLALQDWPRANKRQTPRS